MMITDEKISIVVPFHNEEKNIPVLYKEIIEVMNRVSKNYEMIFVDDKSTDNTFNSILSLMKNDPRIVCVKLRRNHGQTGALAAGFDHVTGSIVVSMDGDLQHDPADIPELVKHVASGEFDIASGWRKHRVDPYISRKLPSKIANWIMAKFSGLDIHDFGTTFKAYREEILKKVHLYGELHRFIPALALMYGARVIEVPIKSRKRKFGKSHYNIMRTFRVLFDLITIRFFLRYMTRPLHFFGLPGLFCFITGGGTGMFLLIKKIVTGTHIFAQHAPLLLMAVLLIIAGIQLICFGLLGEFMTRIYFESSNKTIYTIDHVYRYKDIKEPEVENQDEKIISH